MTIRLVVSEVMICQLLFSRTAAQTITLPVVSKLKKRKKSFSLIANVTLAVTLWRSRPPRLFFAWCHFLPGIRGLVISLPITLARPRPSLARAVPLHPSSPQHPPPPPSLRPPPTSRPDFSCLWLCHSQHMPASVENTIAIFFAGGVSAQLPERSRGLIYGE